MTQEITLSLEETHVHFIKEHAAQIGTTISKIVDNYLELLQKADAAYKRENIHPQVAAISGIVSKNEIINSSTH